MKRIKYETVDFIPSYIYREPIIIKPTEYKIPNVPYNEQYESRDF